MPHITVNGIKYAVELSEFLRLQVTVGETVISANDGIELEKKVRDHLAKTKVVLNIPVVAMMRLDNNTPAYKRIFIRGQHARTRRILVTCNGEKFDVDQLAVICRSEDLTDEQMAELNVSHAAKMRAHNAHSDVVRKYDKHLTVRGLIDEETQKALAKEDEST